MIKRSPTAFDKEKGIEELQEAKRIWTRYSDDRFEEE